MIYYIGSIVKGKFIIKRELSDLMGNIVDKTYKVFEKPYILPITKAQLDEYYRLDEVNPLLPNIAEYYY